MTRQLQRIALLIDADNTSVDYLDKILDEIAKRGRVAVKRAYGNWRKDCLKNWEKPLKRRAIKAEQQFDYAVGKNATDMLLTIQAVDLLWTKKEYATVSRSFLARFRRYSARL